jgi:cation diffusion facilitator family transporter
MLSTILTDTVSSVITIVSFKLASKPADRRHPFGHGRIEYLSALVVSMIIMIIGYEFLRTSVQKIMNPTAVRFSLLSLILILSAIPVKIGLSVFNRRLGKKINSSTLRATAVDALSDVLILSLSSVSLITAAFSDVHIDGWLGAVVAVFIMYSGFSIARQSLDPLMGEPPDPEIVRGLVSDMLKCDYVTGVHDLVMHNYGPGRFMASIHAEVPCDVPVICSCTNP